MQLQSQLWNAKRTIRNLRFTNLDSSAGLAFHRVSQCWYSTTFYKALHIIGRAAGSLARDVLLYRPENGTHDCLTIMHLIASVSELAEVYFLAKTCTQNIFP